MNIRKRFPLLFSLLFATIAFSLSCIGAFGCNFVKFVTPTQATSQITDIESTDSKTRIQSVSHNTSGIWSYQWWDSSTKRYTCHAYPDSIDIDLKWKVARILSTLTIILGGLYLLSLPIYRVIPCCYHSSQRKQQQYHYQFWGVICLTACVSETFSLIFLQSNACQDNVIFNLMRNHSCELSTGAKCTYAAMLFWFAAGFLILSNPDNENLEEQAEEEDANLEEPLLQEVV